MKPLSPASKPRGGQFWLVLPLLFGVLSLFFFPSFLPGRTLFSNDTPLGLWLSHIRPLPDAFNGVWADLNSIGYNEGSSVASLSSGLMLLLGPVAYSKFYAPFTLLFLGFGAWCFFRQLKLAPLACVLGALATMLNSGFFSGSCWGVGSQMLAVGLNFLALAALLDTTSPRRWLRVAAAGLAVGMGVIEGVDFGALFSLAVALFVMYQAWLGEGSSLGKLGRGVGQVALVAGVALLLAAQGIVGLVSTNITGIAGMKQDAGTRQQRWDWATQWSLPKREALGLVVPGLFGYRMDARDGANYWGASGRDPAWDRYFKSGKQGPPPGGMLRYSGGGIYAGALVVSLALWALFRGLRRGDPVFSPDQRKWLWFWGGLALISLLLGFGRFAPFYQFVYALPYVSTVRNPAKFIGIVEWALVILFAYGVDGLSRCYLQNSVEAGSGGWSRLKQWWSTAEPFDQKWAKGSLIFLQISLAAWVTYILTRKHLVAYLQEVDFNAEEAAAVASFSVRQPGWSILFFALSLGLLTLVFSGCFQGPRARTGALLLGLLLVLDLGRANRPWLVYFDYPSRYVSNPVIDRLREKPYEHRVAVWPFQQPPDYLLLDQLYRVEWLQHQFRCFNIQSLDVVQMRSKPADLVAFETALRFEQTTNTLHRVARRWQLTNTRYLLAPAAVLPVLNQQLAPPAGPFRFVSRFDIQPKPGLALATRCEELTVTPRPEGRYALFEFAGALLRASLYSHWQVNTNAQLALEQLASPAFAPEQTVLVSQALPTPPPAPGINQTPGPVEFVRYAPKDIVLQAEPSVPAVLLLNDRFDPNWRVFVDGRPGELLRCNYLMRGVYLPPGKHQVEFRFQPPQQLFYVSLATLVAGVLLCVGLVRKKE